MPMPKGHKSDFGYSTVASTGGMGYREIAEHMTLQGDKMNHSTARNVFVASMKKLARASCEFYGIPTTEENIKRVSNDPRFQSGICDILRDI